MGRKREDRMRIASGKQESMKGTIVWHTEEEGGANMKGA